MRLVSQSGELVGTPAAPLRARRRRLKPLLRLRVRLRGDLLTRQLAAGERPSLRPELHHRALELTARPGRDQAARAIEGALADAGVPPSARGARSPIPPLDFDSRGQLAALAARLRGSADVRAQGVALALLLVTDPVSPLHSSGGTELRGAIATATQALESGPPTV